MKSNDWTLDLLKLVFHNTPVDSIGDATGFSGSSVAGSLYVSLHTADPGRAGAQTTHEANYLGYSRAMVPRTKSRWTIELLDKDIGPVRVTNATIIVFPESTGGSALVTYAAIGVAANGPGKLLYPAKLIQPLTISAGIIPEFRIGDMTLTEK